MAYFSNNVWYYISTQVSNQSALTVFNDRASTSVYLDPFNVTNYNASDKHHWQLFPVNGSDTKFVARNRLSGPGSHISFFRSQLCDAVTGCRLVPNLVNDSLDNAAVLHVEPWQDGTYKWYSDAFGAQNLAQLVEQGDGTDTWIYLSNNISQKRRSLQWNFKPVPTNSRIDDRAWSTIPTAIATSTISPSNAASSQPGATHQQSAGTLSPGAQTGIGVGVAIAVLALIAAALLVFRRRRKARLAAARPPPDMRYKAIEGIGELQGTPRAEMP